MGNHLERTDAWKHAENKARTSPRTQEQFSAEMEDCVSDQGRSQ